MADRPNAYVTKVPGDIIRSGDWNELQIQAREEIRAHTHAGGAFGTQIPREGIAPKAVDGSLIDPEASVALKNLNTSADIAVQGSLTVKGREMLNEIESLLAKVKNLDDNKLDRSGDTVKTGLNVANVVRIGLEDNGSASKSISFVRDPNDEPNAGRIFYKGLGSDALSIVGAGGAGNRKIRLSDNVEVTGDLTVSNRFLNFGASVRQMINLWRTEYGIGVQSSTQYFRTNKNFAWYKGGTHNDAELNTGGGDVQMVLRDGSLGIGILSPTHRFHVVANDAVGLFESSGSHAYLRFSTNEGFNNRVEIANRPGGRLALWTAGGGDSINITRAGNVGIGTDSPGSKLTVQGVFNASRDPESGIMNGGQFAIKGNAPQIDFIDTDHPDWAIHVNSGRMYFIREPWTYDSLVLGDTGNVGIGTADPKEGKLVVKGSGAGISNSYGYLNKDSPTGKSSGVVSYSLYADGRIACPEFNAFSDERTKTIQGRSDGSKDLQTLLGIEITDFVYKDVVRKGDAPHKKLVAQQVERVFPQAVGRQTDVVPDIYQQASLAENWILLATDLKKGERVSLITDASEGVYEVLEVMPDKFRTDLKPAGDAVFVFGREVNDFRSIDYDAIAMLNVSATQQIIKEMEALKTENTALNARLNALEEKARR